MGKIVAAIILLGGLWAGISAIMDFYRWVTNYNKTQNKEENE
jgi:hypothetical protein